jgi:predicted ATP-grasp superfamily ATP-dependent carboligase
MPQLRIFICEYLSQTTGSRGGQDASLDAEGWAMLSALVADFAGIAGVQVQTLVDPCWRSGPWPRGVEVHVTERGGEEEHFAALAREADTTLVIAPEFRGILAHQCRLVESCGGRLLGPASAAVEATADKLRTAELLSAAGVPTPATMVLSPSGSASLPACPLPWICKPRDGAGSQATFRIDDAIFCQEARRLAGEEGWQGELVLQPYLSGVAASVACLVGPDACVPLPAAEQCLSSDGRFHYQGGRLPLAPALRRRAEPLACRAVAAIPGLCGYVGVDLVLGDAADGSGDTVIEINPRPTTSYVGLRRLAQFNLAEAILAAGLGRPLPPMSWRDATIHFRADGSLVE